MCVAGNKTPQPNEFDFIHKFSKKKFEHLSQNKCKHLIINKQRVAKKVLPGWALLDTTEMLPK